MLTEVLIYIALFAALFSGAFMSVFQTLDATKYLQDQKNSIDNLYYLQAKLDLWAKSDTDWNVLSSASIENEVSRLVSSSNLLLDSLNSQIIETGTSTNRVMLLTLGINKKIYTFSYVQEK